MKIAACPRCGSKQIGMGTMGGGIIFGVTSWKSMCRTCGYQGEPILFDTETEYCKFFQQLPKDDSMKTTTDSTQTESNGGNNTSDLSEKDKEVLSYLQDLKEDTAEHKDNTHPEVFAHDKSWWPELCISLLVATVILFLSAPRLFLLYEFFFGFIYIFAFFVVQTLIILIGIVIIEYIYKSITANKIK